MLKTIQTLKKVSSELVKIITSQYTNFFTSLYGVRF